MSQNFHHVPTQKREDYSLDPRWCVANKEGDTSRCVVMLAGRTQKQNMLPSIYWYHGLKDLLLVGLSGKSRAWYPQPEGAKNQTAALQGLPFAIKQIEGAVAEIRRRWGIPKEKIILLGFSAGGVMAIQVAAHSQEAYAGVICQSGAILEPAYLPRCRHPNMPVLLTHSHDDSVFDWYERYTPMKLALVRQQYCLSCIESPFGGHSLNDVEIAMAKVFMRRCFREGEKFLR